MSVRGEFATTVLAMWLAWTALGAYASAQPDGTSDELTLDFEKTDLSPWRPRTGDEPFIQYTITDALPLEGRHSLRCSASGWRHPRGDDTNEQVVLRYDLQRPILVYKDTEISWRWWVGDDLDNDGVGLRLLFDRLPEGLEWASHSNHERGRYPFHDPPRQPCAHHATIGNTLTERVMEPELRLPFPWRLEAIEIFFWFPEDQTLHFDVLRIGPPRETTSDDAAIGQDLTLAPRGTSVLLADLNGDDRPDMVQSCPSGPLLVWLQQRSGRMIAVAAEDLGLSGADSLLVATAADLDADGSIDLLGIRGGRRDELVIFRGLGNGRFRQAMARPAALRGPPNPPAALLVADILPASGPELVLTRWGNVAFDSIYTKDEGWRYLAEPFLHPTDAIHNRGPRSAVSAVDIDNDHDVDFLCTNADVFLRASDGYVCATSSWLPEAGLRQTGVAWADIDTDGDLDLFIAVDSANEEGPPRATHKHSLLYLNEGIQFSDVSTRLPDSLTSHAHNPIFADFDLDGDVDLFLIRQKWQSDHEVGSVYFANDGSGCFRPFSSGHWLAGMADITQACCYDADIDGDIDVLTVDPKRGATLRHNPLEHGRAIKVRVVDPRGVAHLAGAQIGLFEENRLVGYRQTGAGEILSGWGEAVFGCRSDAPLNVVVTFPSQPASPVVFRGVRPGGETVIAVEPHVGGRLVALLSGAVSNWRRVARVGAALGWPILLPAALAFGAALGIVGYGLRRVSQVLVRRRKNTMRFDPSARTHDGSDLVGDLEDELVPGAVGGWFHWPARCVAGGTCLLSVLALLPVAFLWPQYDIAVAEGRAALVVLLGGVGAGIVWARLDSLRRKAVLNTQAESVSVHLQLLDALDGFTHADWFKDLSGIASLCGSLPQGSDPRYVGPRLVERLAAYDSVIHPQMERITRLLPRCSLVREFSSIFFDHVKRLDHDLRPVREALSRGLTPEVMTDVDLRARLAALPETISGMRELFLQIFHRLGMTFQARVDAELHSAMERLEDDQPAVMIRRLIPPNLPPVFALRGELANIFENLISNAIRAAKDGLADVEPEVSVTVQRQADLVVVQVRNSGRAISDEQLLAARATRVLGAERHGRGLGYATRRLRLFDGKIDAYSPPAGGTVFSVTLRVVGDGVAPHGGDPQQP